MRHVHLVVENLGLARFGLWNQGLVKDIKNILADLLELGLDLLAVVTDGRDVLLGSLGLLLLFDGGDDAPGGTASANDVLVGNGKKVTLIDGELATKLSHEVLVAVAKSEICSGRILVEPRTLATSFMKVTISS